MARTVNFRQHVVSIQWTWRSDWFQRARKS